MDAGVATDESSVVHGESMRVHGVGCEVDGFEHTACCGIVLHQARLALGVLLAVVPGQLPDGSVVPRDAVEAVAARRFVERDEKFGLPGCGVDAENTVE